MNCTSSASSTNFCTHGGFVLLASPENALSEAARERDFPCLESAVSHACKEGAVHQDGITAAPLYVHGKLAGALGVIGTDCSELLSAVVSLANVALESSHECEQLRTENTLLKSQVQAIDTGIVGERAAIRHLRSLIARVAPQEATVLVLGESGAGKELVARARSMPEARARSGLSSPSIARRSRRRGSRKASSNWPREPRCSSTKSANSRPPAR